MIAVDTSDNASWTVTRRTGELRWFANYAQQPPRLQEALQDIRTGRIEWRDIPLVIEPTTPPPSGESHG